jgi:hypothetical protein
VAPMLHPIRLRAVCKFEFCRRHLQPPFRSG